MGDEIGTAIDLQCVLQKRPDVRHRKDFSRAVHVALREALEEHREARKL